MFNSKITVPVRLQFAFSSYIPKNKIEIYYDFKCKVYKCKSY